MNSLTRYNGPESTGIHAITPALLDEMRRDNENLRQTLATLRAQRDTSQVNTLSQLETPRSPFINPYKAGADSSGYSAMPVQQEYTTKEGSASTDRTMTVVGNRGDSKKPKPDRRIGSRIKRDVRNLGVIVVPSVLIIYSFGATAAHFTWGNKGENVIDTGVEMSRYLPIVGSLIPGGGSDILKEEEKEQ